LRGVDQSRGVAAGVDVGRGQATGGEVGHLRRQRLDAQGQVHRGQLGRRRAAGGGVDHQHLAALGGQCRGHAIQHDTAEGHVRVGHQRQHRAAAAGEQAAQAVGLVLRHAALRRIEQIQRQRARRRVEVGHGRRGGMLHKLSVGVNEMMPSRVVS
jgi:hypothetical protein